MKRVYLKPEIDLTSMYVEQVICTSPEVNDDYNDDGEGQLTKEHNVFGGNWEEF